MGLGFRGVAKEITSVLNLGEDEGKIDALAGSLDPQEPTRPRTFRGPVLGHAARFRLAVKALLLADHLPNNIAARNGRKVHRVSHLRGAEGGW